MLLLPLGVRAQTRTIAPSRAPLELPQVTHQAGTIFSGRVVSIQPVRIAGSDQVASVAVTFQVEQGSAARTRDNISPSASGLGCGPETSATA